MSCDECAKGARDACGCCEDEVPALAHRNPPGQPALNYRLGTHGVFLRRMLARIPRAQIPDGPNEGKRPLGALKTRAPDDFSIALLDAWALAADVVTFYQERIANEGFLATATERKSVMELARAIGYELNPGVSAATWLAFVVEDAQGAPGRVKVPKGTRAMSIPGQDEKPQTFETMDDLDARAEWNAMRPVRTRPVLPRLGDKSLTLKGVSTLLKVGDPILIVGDEQARDGTGERWDWRRVTSVEADPKADVTKVAWNEGLGFRRPGIVIRPAAENPRVYALRSRAALFGSAAPPWDALSTEVRARAKADGGAVDTNEDGSTADPGGAEWPDFTVTKVNELSGAPADETINVEVPGPAGPVMREVKVTSLHLDAVYPKVVKGSWAVVAHPRRVEDNEERQGHEELYRVEEAIESGAAAFGLSAKVTRLRVKGENQHEFDGRLRDAAVFLESEPLEVALAKIVDPVKRRQVQLDRLVPGLQTGQAVLLVGKASRVRVRTGAIGDRLVADDGVKGPERLREGESLVVVEAPRVLRGGRLLPEDDVPEQELKDKPDTPMRWRLRDAHGFEGTVDAPWKAFAPQPALEDDPELSEPATLAAVSTANAPTLLTLRAPLRRWYDPQTVTLTANVVLATHGETAREVLGSGDGRREHARFVLKRPGLTHEPSPTPRGGTPALRVLVNGVAWKREEHLLTAGPRDEAYVLRIDEEGNASVVMGDGRNGARLPTGEENVVAVYRHGVGRAGNVRAGQLKLLATRPLGVRDVGNPMPASGGADPEAFADAKQNAPRSVLTLGRIVSLQDFEDFAASYQGIGKARVDVLRVGADDVVHVTVADAQGAPPEVDSLLLKNLRAAMDAARDRVLPLVVQGHVPRAVHVEARVKVDPRREKEAVHRAIKDALAAALSFPRRAFGQHVTAAEVVALVQGVPGVLAVDLERLHFTGRRPASDEPPTFLEARPARHEEGELLAADLLLLAPQGVTLTDLEEKE